MATVLIGPPGAGKSTVGAALALATHRPFVDADDVGPALYAEVGWSLSRFARRIDEVGYGQAHAEWEPALAHAVERLLEPGPDRVTALGAGHTHLGRPDLFARIGAALAGSEVVLLRPAADPHRSVTLLRHRCRAAKGHDWIRDGVDWLHRWSTDGCDDSLATRVLVTGDEPPAATVARLLAT